MFAWELIERHNVATLGPGIVQGGKFLNLLRLSCGEVS